jgi:tetratricopeptide (TPR) repeat protein
MKPVLILPIAVVVSAAASYVLCATALNAPDTQAAAPAASPADVERIAASVRALQESQSELARQIGELKSDLAMRPAATEARLPIGDIEAAVARALDARATTAKELAAAASAPAKKQRTAQEGYDAVMKVSDDWDEATKVWAELREQGLVDEVLALFEKKVKDDPTNPTAQVDLGEAYLQKLFTVPAGPEQGLWAMKADGCFDSALQLDDHHWGARFNKAVSLSNWPAFMGKQKEAAKHFETLIAQQNESASKPEHAQTYFFLGNLYQSMGKDAEALATWNKGLALFPGHPQLAGQIQSAQGH